MSADLLSASVIEVVELPHVGFELYVETSAGRRPRFFSLFSEPANAEAKAQYDIAVAFHEMGRTRGIDRPAPVLKLWEGDDAKP